MPFKKEDYSLIISIIRKLGDEEDQKFVLAFVESLTESELNYLIKDEPLRFWDNVGHLHFTILDAMFKKFLVPSSFTDIFLQQEEKKDNPYPSALHYFAQPDTYFPVSHFTALLDKFYDESVSEQTKVDEAKRSTEKTNKLPLNAIIHLSTPNLLSKILSKYPHNTVILNKVLLLVNTDSLLLATIYGSFQLNEIASLTTSEGFLLLFERINTLKMRTNVIFQVELANSLILLAHKSDDSAFIAVLNVIPDKLLKLQVARRNKDNLSILVMTTIIAPHNGFAALLSRLSDALLEELFCIPSALFMAMKFQSIDTLIVLLNRLSPLTLTTVLPTPEELGKILIANARLNPEEKKSVLILYRGLYITYHPTICSMTTEPKEFIKIASIDFNLKSQVEPEKWVTLFEQALTACPPRNIKCIDPLLVLLGQAYLNVHGLSKNARPDCIQAATDCFLRISSPAHLSCEDNVLVGSHLAGLRLLEEESKPCSNELAHLNAAAKKGSRCSTRLLTQTAAGRAHLAETKNEKTAPLSPVDYKNEYNHWIEATKQALESYRKYCLSNPGLFGSRLSEAERFCYLELILNNLELTSAKLVFIYTVLVSTKSKNLKNQLKISFKTHCNFENKEDFDAAKELVNIMKESWPELNIDNASSDFLVLITNKTSSPDSGKKIVNRATT